MENNYERFSDPNDLLTLINKKNLQETEGKLKIFLGMVAGVGKTHAMLVEAHQLNNDGVDLVIGLVEPHQRAEIHRLMQGLPSVPLKQVRYKNVDFKELDIDAILERKPQVVLVDELAHSNIPGSRHTKRYLDIIEILKHGIDVHTCLNIQHLESLNDTVKEITGLSIQETVPDAFLERANEIVIIDLPPDALLKRLKEGKIYPRINIDSALNNFFREGNLAALREIALRFLAEKVENELRDYKILNKIPKVWKTGNRLMVGVFASPYSETLIRATKRMAGALGANWIGAYVDNGRPLSDEETILLENNLSSVSAMGGEVVTTKDDDVTNGLIRIARQNQITQIVIGRTKRNWKSFFRQTLSDRLFKEKAEIDVLVVATYAENKKRKITLPQRINSIKFFHIYWGLSVIFITTVLSFFLSKFMGYRAIGFVYLLATTVSAMWLRLEVVLGMAILSGFVWNYLFIPPQYTLLINSPEDWMMLIANLVTAGIIGTLTRQLKSKQRMLEARETTTAELYLFTKEISSARGMDSIIKTAIGLIGNAFGVKVGVLLQDTNEQDKTTIHNSSEMMLGSKDIGIAKWVFQNKTPAGKFTQTLPSSDLYFTPIKTAAEIFGVLVIDLKNYKTLTHEEKLLLDNLSGQLALGIARDKMETALNKVKLFEESNKIYNTLMDSVSHELKTPLSIIHGSATALKEDKILNNKEAVSKLADEILSGSIRMQNLVQNLLDINRIEANKVLLKKEPVAVNEIINMVLNKVSAQMKDKTLKLELQKDLPLLQIDFVMMEQAIRNIIDNALIYTPKGTELLISTQRIEQLIQIKIQDSGPGLPKEEPEKVFEKFYREKANISGGTGLGLTISKSIVELHGGKISASNKINNSGAVFVITLPINGPSYE